jgi:hypothetical protein
MNATDTQPISPPWPKSLFAAVTLAFGALTAAALWQHGYWGVVEPLLTSLNGAQVFADLVIALCLALVWLFRDARAIGRNPWPWFGVTLVLGSFGPLLYWLTRRA